MTPCATPFSKDACQRALARHRSFPDDIVEPPSGAARGVVCKAEQVIVTTGAQAALMLAAQMMVDPGDQVWLEDPGYLGARGAFIGAGADIVPVPVDDEGINVNDGRKLAPTPRLIYVTPSHQFPLGSTLSLQRRLELLEFAREANAWILEDDYDSEYRYTGRPLASLQGLDRSDRVLYMGTFAKTLFPALRVGYLIVPENLVDAFRTAIRLTGHVAPASIQAALADFISEGHYGTHVRRMRAIYADRRLCLINAAQHDLEPWLEVSPGDGGMQMVGYLHGNLDDRKVAALAKKPTFTSLPCRVIHFARTRKWGSTWGLQPFPRRGSSRRRNVLLMSFRT